MNPTIEKFGYPETLVREFGHWLILLRLAQPTLGSLVLAAKSDATAFGDLPAEAHAELKRVMSEIETALGSFVQYQKLNYLMLMMVDPQVHFHVIPRYEGSRALPPIPASSASSCSTLRYSPRGPGRSWSSWQWSSAGNCSLSSAARNSARATRS